MEALNNYNFKGYNFTLWFFRIISLMIITIVVLVFVLQINETITISEGEIIAGNPQADYKAPFEAQVIAVRVKVGQQVAQGDTLLELKNLDYQEQFAKTNAEIEYLQKKIQSISVLQSVIRQKQNALSQAGTISSKKYQIDINKLVGDMKAIDQQYTLQQNRLSSAKERLEGDSILYKKNMLSRYDYNSSKDASITVEENLANMQSLRNKQATEQKSVYNNLTREQNTLQLSKVQLEENEQMLVQSKNENESQLLQAKATLSRLNGELSGSLLLPEIKDL